MVSGSVPNIRELYSTDQGTLPSVENFTLPSVTMAFAVQVPAGTFDAGSPNFTLGLVEVSTRYRFSQRRTNIGDLVNT